MTASPRGDGSEEPVGKVDVPKTGYDTEKRPVLDRLGNNSPGCAATDLHEIHLARQSSLQVPVGHITVPGGIKLCSPGTFEVANYLIINNVSCQVNFTKSIWLLSDTPTHSGSPRMPLRHLWARWPFQRPVRRTLCHVEMALKHL